MYSAMLTCIVRLPGGVAVPAAVLGIVAMGVIIKKFKIGELGEC